MSVEAVFLIFLQKHFVWFPRDLCRKTLQKSVLFMLQNFVTKKFLATELRIFVSYLMLIFDLEQSPQAFVFLVFGY